MLGALVEECRRAIALFETSKPLKEFLHLARQSQFDRERRRGAGQILRFANGSLAKWLKWLKWLKWKSETRLSPPSRYR
jgi:hypothetical protein